MKNGLRAFILGLAVIFIYFNLRFWHQAVLGWFLFFLFLYFASAGFEAVLAGFFHFSRGFRRRVIAAFVCFSLVGLLAGLAALSYRLTDEAIVAVLILTALLSLIASKLSAKAAEAAFDESIVDGETNAVEIERPLKVQARLLGVLVFGVLVFFGLRSLWLARAGDSLITPWQIIQPNFIYIFFLAVLVLGLLVFSRLRLSLLLFLLVVGSFLLHAYLPLTHSLFYGADGWRHLAVERQIIDGKKISVRDFSEADDSSLIKKINPGLFAYGQFWGAEAILARVLGMDLIKINAWLLPIIWPLIFTLLLFELGLALGWGTQRSLFLVWLSLWPFALQAAGAFSLPVNFGFLFWLFLVLLLIKRAKEPGRGQVGTLALFGAFSLFGYLLYAVLFFWGWFVIEILRLGHRFASTVGRWIVNLALLALSAVLIPGLEIIARYSNFNPSADWLSALKQFFGNFSAFYLASGPRPHAISTGNVFFNQMPSYALIGNAFNSWLWWIFGLMALVLIGLVAGWWLCLKGRDLAAKWLAIFSFGVFGGYFISRYFLSGENVLARRLDVVLALCGLLLLFFVLNKIARPGAVPWIVLIFSAAMAASYSLGPLTMAASENEYQAAAYVWEKAEGAGKSCVVAETMPLLVLEEISKKTIVGGGFPIDENFGQPELGQLYQGFVGGGAGEPFWQEAEQLTGAKECFFIAPFDRVFSAVNSPLAVFGKTAVWGYNK